jgi:energy-coupling factor transporter transmembrane protein EcfT
MRIGQAAALDHPYMRFIVGFRCEALRRLGDAMRSRFGDRRMKTTRARAHPWVYFVVGATAWFAISAIYGYVVNA